jgi:short-subunit dehydrogenase
MSTPARSSPTTPRSTLVVLTGAANGIGRATAFALAERGYRLGLLDRDDVSLNSVAAQLRALGSTVAVRAADVRVAAALRTAIQEFEAELGPTDVVVACAGVGTLSSATDLDVEGFRRMLEVNVLGVAHTIEAVLPGMFARGKGHIVGIASVAGYRGLPWMPGYSASKAAVATYLEGLRPALKRRGVRITTVYPGFVATGMTLETPFRNPVKMLTSVQAAAYLVRAVERRPRDYTFPLSARLGMGFLRRLPSFVFDRLMDQAGPRALTTEF